MLVYDMTGPIIIIINTCIFN